MSMHTYIGARYVPRFVGTYDATQSYEAMDVVDNGSGTSYIAKVPTPAGTPLTDTDYWFLYGASSGAIVQLQNDMIQAQNDISDLQNIVDRKYIIVTDSYGARTNASSQTFIDLFEANMGLTAGVDLFSTMAGGASFYHPTPANSFEGLLSALTVPDNDAITDIIVVGGANDAFKNAADTDIAIDSFMTYVKTNYKNAKVTLFPCGLTFTGAGMSSEPNVLNTWGAVGKYGGCCAANAEFILRNTDYVEAADNCHPSQTGVDIIAQNLVNYMLGGSIDVNYEMFFLYSALTAEEITDHTAYTMGAGGNAIMRRRNGIATFAGTTNSIGIVINAPSGQMFDITGSGNGIKLTFPKSVISGITGQFPATYCQARGNNGRYYDISAVFNIAVNDFSVYLYMPTTLPSSENVSQLYLRLSATFAD